MASEVISHAIFASSRPHSHPPLALHPPPRPFQVPLADFLVREKAGFAHVMSNLGHDVSGKRFNAHAAMKLHRQGAGTDRHP